MSAPSFSTFSAISEIFVTIAVLYVVLSNYKGKPFNYKLAFLVIIFEFSVNMVYMTTRMSHHTVQAVEAPSAGAVSEIAANVATTASSIPPIFFAIHGIMSLIVFVLLVVYSFLAYRDMRYGRAFFQENKLQTYIFLALWMFSVGSGEWLYFARYM